MVFSSADSGEHKWMGGEDPREDLVDPSGEVWTYSELTEMYHKGDEMASYGHLLFKYRTLKEEPTAFLRKRIHSAFVRQFNECDHGKYTGGARAGQPYKMCEIFANHIITGW